MAMFALAVEPRRVPWALAWRSPWEPAFVGYMAAYPSQRVWCQLCKAFEQFQDEGKQSRKSVIVCHQHDDGQRKRGKILLILEVPIRSYENIELCGSKGQKLAVLCYRPSNLTSTTLETVCPESVRARRRGRDSSSRMRIGGYRFASLLKCRNAKSLRHRREIIAKSVE